MSQRDSQTTKPDPLPVRLRRTFAAWGWRSLGDEAADEIERLNGLVAKWRDEASAVMARAMVAELAAARVRLQEGAANV